MICAEDLIAKFQYALDNHWGYIYGAAGSVWTEAKQKATGNEQARKYGAQWIGHTVADCSGLFTWAFKQLGGTMYHGSDTMFRKYTTASGALKAGKRTDGQELLPGTAVFVYKEEDGKYGHVGLYIGGSGGDVIEAASTQKGVIKSKITDKKWEHWGELKGVTFKREPVPKGYAEVTGTRVALRSGPTTAASVLLRVDTGKRVKKETPPASEWEYVSFGGKSGWMMKKFLRED